MTTATMDELSDSVINNPGAYLAGLREQRGYTQEYIASKLHLRVHLIETLEIDDYDNLPQPVFVKGYLRAYAKLMGENPEPLLNGFNTNYVAQVPCEKALWQNRRESNRSEKIIKWFTILFAAGVFIAVALWWQKNKDTQALLSSKDIPEEMTNNTANTEIRLTDLSKMQAFLSTNPQITPMEKQVD